LEIRNERLAQKDADYILYFEVILMLLFLSMNATDALLQQQGIAAYIKAGSFPISQFLYPLFEDLVFESFNSFRAKFLVGTYYWDFSFFKLFILF